MAETMVTDPVYLDQTAKDNGKIGIYDIQNAK